VRIHEDNTIPIVFCFDRPFGRYASVAIASALIHADAYYKIYCIFSGAANEFPIEIDRLCERFRCELHKIYVSPDSFSSWKFDPRTHFAPSVYYRLLIPELVPEDRVLYLDSDMVVTVGLMDLYSISLNGNWVGGSLDPKGRVTSRIRISADEPYLNSGMLLIDVSAFRTHLPPAKILQVYQENEHDIESPDQCLINKLCEGRKLVIDSRWNFQLHGEGVDKADVLIAASNGRGIVHFSGPLKPWLEWAPAAHSKLWFQYAKVAGLDPDVALKRPETALQTAYLALKYEREEAWKSAAMIWKSLALKA
jgi:lipopolysaccharide biosynthesis glycosyltransferase